MNPMPQATIVGHLFSPSGRGEDARCTFRALRRIAQRPRALDIYGLHAAEHSIHADMLSAQTTTAGDINIFHINGDEVEQAFSHLRMQKHQAAYNIIYPAWELSRYPAAWATQLDLFDEIWAPTHFIAESIRPTVSRPVYHMPFACQVLLNNFLGRRYFGIPEQHFIFLFFFDFRSYIDRKNPLAVIESFRRLLAKAPSTPISLVIKASGAAHAPEKFSALVDALGDIQSHVHLLNRDMSDNEIRNLIRCSDCFISLHRSEGFGRGLAEAMCLGKPVIGTGYSGNMDFMDYENSFPVDYQLVPVAENSYPFWQNQTWAEPDIDHATYLMQQLVKDPALCYRTGERASLTMRSRFSLHNIGLKYAERLRQIAARAPLSSPATHDLLLSS